MRRFGDFSFDPSAGVLWDSEGEVRLRPKTYALLEALVEAAPAILAKDELLDRIWGREHLGETSLAQAVSELRRILGDEAKTPRFIETVHRRGYRFIAPLTEAPPTQAQARREPMSEGVEASGPRHPWTFAGPRRRRLVLALGALAVGVLAALLVVGFVSTIDRGTKTGDEARPQAADPMLRLAVLTSFAGDPSTVPPAIAEVVPSLLAPALQRHEQIQIYSESRLAALTHDLGWMVTPDATDFARRLGYLQADQLVVASVGPADDGDGEVQAIGLSLIDGGETTPLLPATVFDPDALGLWVVTWERAVLEALGLSAARRPSGTRFDFDWAAFEVFVAARAQRSTRPAAALAELERLQTERLNGLRVGRLRVELYLALGEVETARQLALQMSRRGGGFRRHLWYLNLAGQASTALALLQERQAGVPLFTEEWLETLQALETSDRPSDTDAALSALARLPEDLATSWVGAEIRLTEARLADRVGDEIRRRRAAEAALNLATSAGQRRVAQAASAMLESERRDGLDSH